MRNIQFSWYIKIEMVNELLIEYVIWKLYGNSVRKQSDRHMLRLIKLPNYGNIYQAGEWGNKPLRQHAQNC